MNIRPLTVEDWGALDTLMSEAFARGAQFPPDIPDDQRETFDLARRLGAFENGELVAALTVLDIAVHWSGAGLRMGGIAGVGCAAASRGRGHVGRLMTESLAVMREWGQPIAGLYPFSQAFYRRYGWESVGERYRFSIPTRVIPAFPEGRHVRTLHGPDSLETVRPIYDAFAGRYRGMASRTDRAPDFWQRALASSGNKTTYVHIYDSPESGRPEGYLTFRYPESGPATVGEFFALTASAYRGLLTTLHNYSSQIETIEWTGAPDLPIRALIAENELSVKVTPLFMGRIVDVASALGAVVGAPDGAAIVHVADDHAPWNDGVFAIRTDQGRTSVTRTTAAEQIELDILALSAAFWGSPSLALLRDAGRVVVRDAGAFGYLAGLLKPAVPYFQDSF